MTHTKGPWTVDMDDERQYGGAVVNLIQQLRLVLVGAAGMAILVAFTAYTNPALRCVNERGTVWVSAPVGHCYPISQFMPENALKPAR